MHRPRYEQNAGLHRPATFATLSSLLKARSKTMPLLDTDQLSVRFEELIRNAASVDIAVAWVTSCDELDKLCDIARTKPVRVIVGLDGNATHPVALGTLRTAARVRVGIGQPRTFHPKFYLFR